MMGEVAGVEEKGGFPLACMSGMIVRVVADIIRRSPDFLNIPRGGIFVQISRISDPAHYSTWAVRAFICETNYVSHMN